MNAITEFINCRSFTFWQKLNMSAQFDYVEMKENHIQDTRENQQNKDTAEKIPIIKSNERYETIESRTTEGQGDVSDMESETLTGQVFFQLLTCNLAFFSRGLVFNSVGANFNRLDASSFHLSRTGGVAVCITVCWLFDFVSPCKGSLQRRSGLQLHRR
ncbi:hypothetical protein EB796_010497 [Bugula neritina]|uniref:Uncharacterized protein n=1 Tax=Bugula neritina TaxID=10212 RepID=A0A7J7K015_BUGNE|nr:hypothetical protein EB796_010497 [Bugula neritina]